MNTAANLTRAVVEKVSVRNLQQKLAWTGALILTFAVLVLSVMARFLSASVKQK